MYCKKCGYKLMSGKRVCGNCGEPVDSAEYCGGFWGLVGEVPSPIVEKEASDSTRFQKQENDTGKKGAGSQAPESHTQRKQSSGKSKRKMFLAPLVICNVLLLAVIVQSVRMSSVSERLSEKKEEYDELQEKYHAVVEEYKDLSEQITELSEEVSGIKDYLIFENNPIWRRFSNIDENQKDGTAPDASENKNDDLSGEKEPSSDSSDFGSTTITGDET